MEIEIRLDPSCTQPKLTLTAAVMTGELEQLVRQLANTPPHALAGYREETVELLQPEEILRAVFCIGMSHPAVPRAHRADGLCLCGRQLALFGAPGPVFAAQGGGGVQPGLVAQAQPVG